MAKIESNCPHALPDFFHNENGTQNCQLGGNIWPKFKFNLLQSTQLEIQKNWN